MSRTTLPLLALAAALLAAPAQGQHTRVSHGESHIVEHRNGHRLEVRLRGQVEFNDDADWVTGLAPGAWLSLREEMRGREQRLDFTSGGGDVRTVYRVNGRERPLDAEGREWARRVLGDAVRESGFAAESRVTQIRRRAGVNGVLGEIAGLRTDTGRRMYYRALLAGAPLSDAEFARVMDDVGARIRSSTETRLVLADAADRVRDDRGLAALLRAAARIESDTEARLVLTRVAERHSLAGAGVRTAFFQAVDGLNSNTERRLVLNTVTERNALADAGMRSAFFRATDEMDSDTERRLVLSGALRRNASDAVVIDAIRSAGEMRSDTEKRLVLSMVPAAHRRNTRVVDEYRRVVEGMRSDTERRIALSYLMEGR
jgi:hypothetical protein